jgi:hypothetical protein
MAGMLDRTLTPDEADDGARDAIAFLRAHNAGDQDAVRAILSNANVLVVVRMLAPLALGFLEAKARADGFAGDEGQLREFVDEQLRQATSILLAMAPGDPGQFADGGAPRQP